MKLPPLYQTAGKMIRVIQSCETLAQLGCAVRWCTKVCQMYPISEASIWCAQEIIKAIEQHQYTIYKANEQLLSFGTWLEVN